MTRSTGLVVGASTIDPKNVESDGPSSEQGPTQPSTGSIRTLLLVVEDNPGDARLLREMLASQGPLGPELMHVTCMSDAEAYLAERNVDIIVLDLGLPDVHGLEAVRRAHAVAPDIALVVLTGTADESLAIQALQQGAQDYLVKGQIDARGLLRALRYAVERKSLEDAGRAAENQLLQAQKLESIGRLAGGVAHDFNNMLFAIRGYAELLGQDLAASDPAHLDLAELGATVDAICEAADRATSLTAQLLAFSRQQIVTPRVLDLNLAVTNIERMLQQLIGENVQLVLKLDPDAGRIRADPGQIDQMIVNLVVNARDAMPDGGTVTIGTRNVAFDEPNPIEILGTTEGPLVLLSVSDEGVGMDGITLEHMFEPFFTTKDIGRGTGLGLATTYGIVRQAGGDISVRSAPGAGTDLSLYFPRVEADVEREPVPMKEAPVRAGRVLVVEDDPAVRDVLVRFLDRAGYVSVAVADGTDAIAVAGREEPFDALVTDVIMPKISGIAVAEQMMELYPSIAVVLLSGYTAETLDLARITARGAIFVQKPVTSSELLQGVVTAIGARHAAVERGRRP